jgi:uncharacterized protein (DUF488 family)
VVEGLVSPASPSVPATVWTIGHSTRALEEFLSVLAAHRIEAIADVRRFPGSRRHPHFAREALEASLPAASIDYLWLPQLGGRRRPRPDSPNDGWRNEAFRGYADHLASAEFADGFGQLLALASRRRTAMMCSELLWWRCHRSLLSDVLKARGVEVLHIVDAGEAKEHPWTGPARIVDGRLDYSAPGRAGDLFA